MKKILCLLLVCVLLLGLCGCSLLNPFDKGAPSDPVPETQNPPENSGTPAQKDESKDLLGAVTNGVYENDYLGVRFTLPKDWVFYTEEQILQLNNITSQYFDEDTQKLIENATIFYNMYASHPESGSNINMNMEKLSAIQLGYLDIEATLKAQFDALKDAYENMGYTDVRLNYEKVTVDGKTFDGIQMTASIYGVEFYGTVFTFRKDGYLVNVTACSLFTNQTTEILRNFQVD